MANIGQIATGYERPYVAIYENSGSHITYSNLKRLGRGVSVSLKIEKSEDQKFYADNGTAEVVAGTFKGGSVDLAIDGLTIETKRMILGLPEADDNGFVPVGNDVKKPYVGIGYITRSISNGKTSYRADILTKCMFETPEENATTEGESIEFQDQTLTANIVRDDSDRSVWKYIGTERSTPAEAEADIKKILGAGSRKGK